MTGRDIQPGTGPVQSLEFEALSRLSGKSLKPGTSISFALREGKVNITLDSRGDWTIMACLTSQSDRTSHVSYSLERLGFFRAAEDSGNVYFLWTSALKGVSSERSIVEELLFETLRTLQRDSSTHYIC